MVLSSSVTGTTYTWNRDNTTNVTGIGNSGSGDISGTLVNTTNTPQTVTFTITPTANGCAGTQTTATVLVNPTPNAVASPASQTICNNTSINDIILSSAVTGTTYTWTRDNTTNVIGATSGTGNITGLLINNTIIQQTVNYTITPSANGCAGSPIYASVTIEPETSGGRVTVSLPNEIPIDRIVTHCHEGDGTLYLWDHIGTVLRWEYSTNVGITWNPINFTGTTYTYTGLTSTTIFRAIVQSGTGCTEQHSQIAVVNIIPNIMPTVSLSTTICEGETTVLTAASQYASNLAIAEGGDFQDANPPGWEVDGVGFIPAGGSNTDPGPWRLSATNGGTYSDVLYKSQGKFGIVHGDYDSYIETPIFNTFGLSSAELTFNHSYKLLAGADAYVQISTDGGATYTDLAHYQGPDEIFPHNNFTTSPSASVISIDLNNYIGQANLRIRFYYQGNTGSSWAVDNIQIPDAPSNLSTQWVDPVSGDVISYAASLNVSPTTTTTYAITSFLNGCNSFGTEGTAYITVTVNQRPTGIITEDHYVCYGESTTLDVDLTGTAPWTITYSNGITNTTVTDIMESPYVINVPSVTTDVTYTISAIDDNNCTALPSDYAGQATITVLDGTQGVWTGLVSNDWFDCLNWERGLPDSTVDAIIPATSTIMPVIDPDNSPYAAAYNNIASARDLVINAGASVTMMVNSNLEISRNWLNSGDFYPGLGNVTFNGSQNSQVQTINQGIKLFESFYDLTLNTSGTALGVSVQDQFELTVANNLTLLSGDLRLVGEAQMVQNGTSANPLSGSGSLLIDQQGTKSSYHYNYWCPPVSTNGINYSVGSVLFDGTNSDSTPFVTGTISYGSSGNYSDGPLTSPIKISTRWLYKYTASTSNYYSWQQIQNTGTAKIAEGFTMKGVTGSAVFTELQNYTFKGKPNNGDINLNFAANQVYLIGNPYSSALDANQFILDNIKDGGNASTNVINGALYFWDHFGAQTHYLSQYIGGYATYTLMGGVVAVSNDPLINNNNATGTKIPRRYIPVAQGFFVDSTLDPTLVANNPNLTTAVTGGTIAIKNSQRVFYRESSGNSIFFKTTNTTTSASNQNVDTRMKIRLNIDMSNDIRRQLLVGVDPNATDNFDIGYDAPMADLQNDDCYWTINGTPFIIEAVSNFDPMQIIPLGIKMTNATTAVVSINQLENIPSTLKIYLFDNLTNVYHDIKNNDVTLALSTGTYNNRFSLRFSSQTLDADTFNLSDNISIFVNNKNTMLNIENSTLEQEIKKVYLFNILGQKVFEKDIKNVDQTKLQYDLNHLSEGTYIVKLSTNKGEISKKVIISYN